MRRSLGALPRRELDEFILARPGGACCNEGVRVTVVPPSPRLAPYVRHFNVVEASEETTRVLLPESGLVLGLRWAGAATELDVRGETRLADATLTGVRGAARTMRTSSGGGIVVALFKEGGAARFFAEPMHEIFGRSLALEDLVPRADVARASEQMFAAQDLTHRVAAMTRFLEARLRPQPLDPVVSGALAAIVQSRGAIRIGELARRLEIRQDPLEKRFRGVVGTSPKHMATLLRVRHAIDRARSGASLTRVAHDAGYFDQSHFIRDFRALAGAPPARFLRETPYC